MVLPNEMIVLRDEMRRDEIDSLVDDRYGRSAAQPTIKIWYVFKFV